jgi:hypothetical protein
VQPPQVSRCAATHTYLHTGYTCSYETQKAHANHSLVTPLCFGVLCWFVVGLMEMPLQPVCTYLLYKPCVAVLDSRRARDRVLFLA